jgi:hypothetical protein
VGRAEASPASRLVYARGPGAEDCPDETVFRQEVSTRLGYDPFFPWATRTVSVEIEAVDGRARARVVVVDEKGFEQGAQTIDGGRGPIASTCVGLVRGAALAVSVSLDAMPSPPPPEPEEATQDPAPAPPPVTPVSPPPVDVERVVPIRTKAPVQVARKPRRVGLSVAPQVWLGYGQWPVVTAGVGGAVELRYGAASLGFEGRWDAPSTIDIGQGAQAQIQRATASVVPCAHVTVLAICAEAALGETWATGVGVQGPMSASAFYAAFGGRVGLDVPFGGRFRWGLMADLVGIATPMHLIVTGTPSFDSGPVALSFGTSLSTSIF